MALALGKYPLLVIAASAALASRSPGQTAPPVNILAGAQAFITADEARFVFPRQASDSYDWDVPIHGDPPTGGELIQLEACVDDALYRAEIIIGEVDPRRIRNNQRVARRSV